MLTIYKVAFVDQCKLSTTHTQFTVFLYAELLQVHFYSVVQFYFMKEIY